MMIEMKEEEVVVEPVDLLVMMLSFVGAQFYHE
jgi:hypothetical protein